MISLLDSIMNLSQDMPKQLAPCLSFLFMRFMLHYYEMNDIVLPWMPILVLKIQHYHPKNLNIRKTDLHLQLNMGIIKSKGTKWRTKVIAFVPCARVPFILWILTSNYKDIHHNGKIHRPITLKQNLPTQRKNHSLMIKFIYQRKNINRFYKIKRPCKLHLPLHPWLIQLTYHWLSMSLLIALGS